MAPLSRQRGWPAWDSPDPGQHFARHSSSRPQPENWVSFGSVTQIISETQSQASEQSQPHSVPLERCLSPYPTLYLAQGLAIVALAAPRSRWLHEGDFSFASFSWLCHPQHLASGVPSSSALEPQTGTDMENLRWKVFMAQAWPWSLCFHPRSVG